MKPFGHRLLSREERIFNYRLSRARRVVENAFGILANRFRVLLTRLMHPPDTVNQIVTVCCILHNIFHLRNPANHINLVDREDEDHNLVPGAWRHTADLTDMEKALRGSEHNKEAKAQRFLLRSYYNNAGSVPWQDRMIRNYNY